MRVRTRLLAGLAALAALACVAIAVLVSRGDREPRPAEPSGPERGFAFEGAGEGEAGRSTTLSALARRGEAIVTARATRTEQVPGGETRASFTRQRFVLGEALAGSVPRRFVVRFFGGETRTPDAVVPADPEDPAFERGRSYLLVLRGGPDADLTIVGPAAGRYEVGRSGLEPVGTGLAQSALGGLSPVVAAKRIARERRASAPEGR